MNYVLAVLGVIILLAVLVVLVWAVFKFLQRRHPTAAAGAGVAGLLAVALAMFSFSNDVFFNLANALNARSAKNAEVVATQSAGPAVSTGSSTATTPGAPSSPPAVPAPSSSGDTPEPWPVATPTTPGRSPTRPAPAPAAPLSNVVNLVSVTGAGNQVTATVEVGAPPAADHHYIVVARFDSSSRYDMKADVPHDAGRYDIPFDLGGAPEGSWRDFAVLAVTADELAAWRPSLTGASLSSFPGGDPVTPWKSYQR